MPVVSVAATAPAWAASPCDGRSSVATTSGSGPNGSIVGDPASPAPGYTRNSATTAVWTTNDPSGSTYTHATITVREDRTTSTPGTQNVAYGYQTDSTANLALYNTGTVVGPSINQRPATSSSPRGFANRTITTFTFDRTVYGLQFKISDITKSSTPATITAQNPLTAVGFWDAVFVESTSAFRFADRGNAVRGTGTQGDPFTASRSASDADVNAESDVTVIFTAPVKELKIHYWSADMGVSDSRGGQGITLSNMSMQVAPAICP